MADELLILTFDGVDQQYLAALDKMTGKTVWRTDRTTDYGDIGPDGLPQREGDLRKAYSTPGVVMVDGRKQIVSVGSRAAFGYDALTGEELWTIRHDDFNAAARPLFLDGLALLNTGSSNANLLAVRLASDTRGDVTETHVVWDRPKGNSRLASPVLHRGRIYMVSGTGVATCVDARSGEEIWKGRVPGNYVASPIIVRDKLYLCSEEGVTSVLSTGDAFLILHRNELAEGQLRFAGGGWRRCICGRSTTCTRSIRDQGSGIRDQGSGIRDQGSGISPNGAPPSQPRVERSATLGTDAALKNKPQRATKSPLA